MILDSKGVKEGNTNACMKNNVNACGLNNCSNLLAGKYMI
ncbi:hypothetical protein SAMN05660816_01128 [Niastella yeongjuensis]|nr:hypothetical protein SAMN05660816_01128 [Niastella yeongjuensis]